VPNLDPWATVFWKGVAILMVLMAGSHGLHGVLSVLDDYFAQPRMRAFFRILIAIILLVMWAIGIYVIWTS